MTDIAAVIRSREHRRQLVTRLITLGIAAAMVGFGGWFIGADVWHAVASACVLIAVFLVFILAPESLVPDWPDLPADSRDGARHEVNRLSWSLVMRSKEVRDSVLVRVENIARNRLRHHRLDLDDPGDVDAIRHLLGQRAYSTVDPARSAAVSLADLITCLNSLDSLSDHPGQSEPPFSASANQEEERVR